jgi:mono/diheme cytochrome c family protein
VLNRLQVVAAMGLSLTVTGVAAGQTPAIEKGMQVFAAQKCAICHAVAGKGNARGALDGVGSKLTADEIRQWIVDAPAMAAKTNATRKPVMRAYASLPKDDIDGLVAYLLSLKKP